MRWQLVAAVFAAFALGGCSCAGAGVDELPFACSTDEECEPPDWLCRRGECVRADAGCAVVALEICNDGLENDCDGLIDCADDECAAEACGPAGRLCTTGSCACPPGGTDGGFAETVCGDGLDDDCDQVVDCDDPDCAGRVCNTSGLVCVGADCECPADATDAGITPEITCNDGIDNDCDLLVDCDDPSCDTAACAVTGTCSGTSCVCPAGGTPERPETTCSDSADNDCDGLADCSDLTDCAGQSCGADGVVCSNGSCVCSGNGGTAQPTGETVCDDTRDNDCDGTADCEDPGCDTAACGLNGRFCAGTTCACSGNGGTAQAFESICDDGHDNDCDSRVDCAETACDGDPCGANGLECSGGACACSGNGGTPQPGGETTCVGGFDNDCDGLIDCADMGSCNGRSCGANGVTCNAGSCTCNGGGGVFEPGGETTCNDGADNDCNGQVDCEEGGCDGSTCGPNGRQCFSLTCLCNGNGGAPEQGSEVTCNDNHDNDCDGLIDCADPDCFHELCGTDSVCCSTSATGCRALTTDEANCGGCGLTCAGSRTCSGFSVSGGNSGRCSCTGTGQCPNGQTCTGGSCRCANSSQCAPGEVCDNGTCRY